MIMTLAILLIISMVYLGLSLYFKEYRLIAIGLFMIALGYWFNQDLLTWYHSEQDMRHLAEAKQILNDTKKFSSLVSQLEARVLAVPKDAKAWFLLGRLKAGQGDWQRAHDALLQAYRLAPDNEKYAIFYVETIMNTQGQLNAFARQILHKVLSLQPQQADALIILAADAKQHHCYHQASLYWQQVLAQVPKDAPLYQSLQSAIDEALLHSDKGCKLKD